MASIYEFQHAVKQAILSSNKRNVNSSLEAANDSPDQLMQPPADAYMPYGILDFTGVITNSATTTAAPNTKVAGASADALDIFMNRLELRDAVGGQQRTYLTSRVHIEEAERLCLNLPTPAAGYESYNLAGFYPRPAPPSLKPGNTTIRAQLKFPYGSLSPGEGCYVVFGVPALSTVYASTHLTAKYTVAYREAYSTALAGSWAVKSIKPQQFGSGINDIAQYIPESMSPQFVDFTHATVTPTSTSTTATFTQSLFQAAKWNSLQDTLASIVASTQGYPDVANPTPNYGTLPACTSDVVPFSTHGQRPLIWNLALSQATILYALLAQYDGPAGGVAATPAQDTTQPALVDVAASHVSGAGPATARNTVMGRKVA